MSSAVHELQSEVELLRAQNQELAREMKALERRYQILLDRFRARMAKIFGRKGESLHPDQMQIPFEDLLDIADAHKADELQEEALEAPDAEDADRSPKKRGHGRRKLDKELERVRLVEDVPLEERVCPDCSKEMSKIGEDVREELEYVPASLFIKEHVRPKYACSRCHEGVLSAPPQRQVIQKGLPGPGLLAHVLVSKYVDHLPLHRQAAMFARHGADISRSTMCDWVAGCAERLQPLVDLLKKEVLASFLINCDDTPILCLENPDGQGKCRAALWVYAGIEATVYDFRPNRARDGPAQMLADFEGYLQGDAYAGFDALYRSGKIVEVGCMAHARRKFFEAVPSAPEKASRMLARIQLLYRVEKEAREGGLDPDATRRLREERSKPVLEAMRTELEALSTDVDVVPKSMLGDAVGYMRRQWDALNRYLEDGRILIDNNAAERALRIVAVGRKNWMFTGSLAGGERAAVIYSLIATCKQHGIEPFAYLRDVLERLPGTPREQVGELLPRSWKAARSQESGLTPT